MTCNVKENSNIIKINNLIIYIIFRLIDTFIALLSNM